MISVKVIVESMLEDPTLKEGQIGQLVLLKTDTSKRLMINGLGSTIIVCINKLKIEESGGLQCK